LQPLNVFAPGSIVPAQNAILDGFARIQPAIQVTFHPPAYSGLLADAIARGAPADVFISASMRYLDDLQRVGLTPTPRAIAPNRLCLIAQPELTPEVRGIDDLARDRLRLVIPPAETDPLGQYTMELLDRRGLTQDIERKRQQGEVREDLASLRGLLAANQVDAAVIYASSVSMFGAESVVIPLPESLDMRDRIVFGTGVVVRGGTRHPAAEPFVGFLMSAAGQAILSESGYLPWS
jgi:molybdate transport system substrate-binding protein